MLFRNLTFTFSYYNVAALLKCIVKKLLKIKIKFYLKLKETFKIFIKNLK